MRFAAIIFFAVFAACFRSGACLAQQAVQQPVEKAAPLSQSPVPVRPAPPVMAAPPSMNAGAPVPAHHSRSLQKAAPAPAAASKPDSGTPDVVVGGLPGEQAATPVEKQP
jgi:hypothetical protein